MGRQKSAVSRNVLAFQTLISEDDTDDTVRSRSRSKQVSRSKSSGNLRGSFRLKEEDAAQSSCTTGSHLTQLSDLFPWSLDILSDVYQACGNSVEATVEALQSLMMGVQTDLPKQSSIISGVWDELPEECRDLIFSKLSRIDKAVVACVCRQFAETIKLERQKTRRIVLPHLNDGCSTATLDAVRGMIKAFPKAVIVDVSPHFRMLTHSWEVDLALEAVFKGERDRQLQAKEEESRWGGIKILILQNCGALQNHHIVAICSNLCELEELNISFSDAVVSRIDDGTLHSLGRYRRGGDTAGGIPQRTDFPDMRKTCHDFYSPLSTQLKVALNELDDRVRTELVLSNKQQLGRQPSAGCGFKKVHVAGTRITSDGLKSLFARGGVARESLAELTISRCSRVHNFDFLPHSGVLQSVVACGLKSLRVLHVHVPPSLPLSYFEMSDCSQLHEAHVSSSTLETLIMHNDKSLSGLSLQCPKLRRLSLHNCPKLSAFTDVQGHHQVALPKLNELQLHNCRSLESEALEAILSASPSPPVRKVNLSGCLLLTRVLAPQLQSLESIKLDGAAALGQVVIGSPVLDSFEAQGCPRLVKVAFQTALPKSMLNLQNCVQLRSISVPNDNFTVPAKVVLKGCERLPASVRVAFS